MRSLEVGRSPDVWKYWCFGIMLPAFSNVSSGFWKKKMGTSWTSLHSCDDATSNNTVRRGAGKDFQIQCLIASDWLGSHNSFPKGDLAFSLPLSNSDLPLILKPVYWHIFTLLLSVLQQLYLGNRFGLVCFFFSELCC